jgi:hypothetical protein
MRIISLFVLGWSLVALTSACSTPVKSRFLATFSTDDVIKRSYSPSGTESPPHYSLDQMRTSDSGVSDKATFDLKKSDESQFLDRLKTEIEALIIKSGGRITGKSSGEPHSIQYEEGTVRGKVDIVPTRREGDALKLSLTITEK